MTREMLILTEKIILELDNIKCGTLKNNNNNKKQFFYYF